MTTTPEPTPTPAPNPAEILARVTGSVSATVVVERRLLTGELVEMSRHTYTR